MTYAILICVVIILVLVTVFILRGGFRGSGVSGMESQLSETSRNNKQQRDINTGLENSVRESRNIVESLERNNKTARDIERENQDLFERIEKRNANK